MPIIRVFISHSWNYTEHYNRLAGWIFEDKWNLNGTPITFLNTSVPRDSPIHNAPSDRALQDAIYERIGASNVVVCPTGMYSTYSKWIVKELAGADLKRVRLLAVNPWAQERKSSVVQHAADEIVGWNKQSVINSVWRLGNK